MHGQSCLLVPLKVMHEIIGFLLAGVSYHGKASIDRISAYCSLGVTAVFGPLGNAFLQRVRHEYITSDNLLAMQDKMAGISRWLYRVVTTHNTGINEA